MPRTQREYMQRYAEQCSNDLERALDRLKLLQEAYANGYPTYENYVVGVSKLLITAKEALDRFREEIL